jgi:hypothetical protein
VPEAPEAPEAPETPLTFWQGVKAELRALWQRIREVMGEHWAKTVLI